MAKPKPLTKRAELIKLRENLNLLKMYFSEYDILEHYLAWLKAKATNTETPKKLKLDE